MQDTPSAVKYGGAITSDGTDLFYVFRGGGRDNFWKFDVSAGTWSSLEDSPGTAKQGGALVYANGSIYAFRGGDKDHF